MGVSVSYNRSVIATLDESSEKKLLTKGKLCIDNIRVKYDKDRQGPDMSLCEYMCTEYSSYTAAYVPSFKNGYLAYNFKNTDYRGGTPIRIIAYNPLSIESPLYVDWTSPFEIGVVFRISKICPVNSDRHVLFGTCRTDIYEQPLLYLSDLNSLVAVFSTDGVSASNTLTFPVYEIQKDTWYCAVYSWDGEEFKLTVTNDFHNIRELSSPQETAHNSPNAMFSFGNATGDVARYGDAFFDGTINMLGTYIKSNGSVVWGCTYCEDNMTFDVI